MKERIQGFILGIVITSLLSCGIVFSDAVSKVINVAYMNVKLVVDGIAVEPKDANGKYVEPFVYNGTTYLPVRAVGQAFNKEVSWDGKSATVFIGGKVDKPAKDVFLFDKPYISCSWPNDYKASGDNSTNFVGYDLYVTDDIGNDRRKRSQEVVFPLNGLAKKVKGSVGHGDFRDAAEVIYQFFDENDELLWQSPIMTKATQPIDFEFDVNDILNLKLQITHTNMRYSGGCFYVKNLTITTTDYK